MATLNLVGRAHWSPGHARYFTALANECRKFPHGVQTHSAQRTVFRPVFFPGGFEEMSSAPVNAGRVSALISKSHAVIISLGARGRGFSTMSSQRTVELIFTSNKYLVTCNSTKIEVVGGL